MLVRNNVHSLLQEVATTQFITLRIISTANIGWQLVKLRKMFDSVSCRYLTQYLSAIWLSILPLFNSVSCRYLTQYLAAI